MVTSNPTPILAQAIADFATLLIIKVLFVLALTAGIAKCWSMSRRPATNRKCVMALALLLVGCILPHAIETVCALIGLPFPGIVDFISLGITLSAPVLAVVGLQEYSRRRGAFRQGKAQAIWTLALSAFVAAYPILYMAQVRWNFLRLEKTPITASVLEFKDLNFKFFAPGKPWQQVESDPFDVRPTLVLRLFQSDVHFAVVARQLTNENRSAERLVAMATNILSRALEGLRITYQGPFRTPQLNGTEVDIEAGHLGKPMYLETRLFEKGGWAYQLLTWAPKRDANGVMELAPKLSLRFQWLDNTPNVNHPPIELPDLHIPPP